MAAGLLLPGCTSNDGSTQVTLLVQEPNGEEQELQFGLLPAQGKPEYTSLRIHPDSEKPAPVLPLPPVRLHPVVPKITSPADNLSQVAPTFDQEEAEGQGAGSRGKCPYPSAASDNEQGYKPHLYLSPLLPLSLPPCLFFEKHLPPPSVADSAPKLPVTSDHTPPPLAPNASAASIDFHLLGSEPSLSTEAIKSQHQATENATAFAFGLLAGIQSGEIQLNTPVWDQAQDTLSRLRRGESLGQALSNSRLSSSTYNYFLTLGHQSNPLLNQNIKSVSLNSNTAKTPPTSPTSSTSPQNNSKSENLSGKAEPSFVIINYFI